MAETICFYLLLIGFTIQLVYQILFLGLFSKQKQTNGALKLPPVSVVLYAKNDAKNLKNNLLHFINQNYSNFEIVVVNHASIDKTKKVMQTFLNAYQHVKLIDVDNNEAFWGNKKYAITLGIKASKFEHIVLSLPNCKPNSNSWLQSLMTKVSENDTPVIAITNPEIKKGLEGSFFRFSTMIDNLLMLGLAKLDLPVTATHENLVFTKKDFFSVKGFANHINTKNGEATLFIDELSKLKKINYTFDNESIIEVQNKYSLKKWLQAKKGSLKLIQNFSFTKKLGLWLFTLSRFLVLFSTVIFLIVNPSNLILITSIIYLIIWLSIVYAYQKKLNQPKQFYLFPILDIQLLLLQCFNFVVYSISKK